MDDLLSHALIGTAKHPSDATGSAHPTDQIFGALLSESPERKLLLRAGARAIYRAAGVKPGLASSIPLPAPPESLPICSQRAAALFEEFLEREPQALRLEAIDRLTRAGQRLPPALLPRALAERATAARSVLRPILGNLGLWLSQFNPDWQWVANGAPVPPSLAEQEAIWIEGTPQQRIAVLTEVRKQDPDLGRAWLEKAWATEKADVRAGLAECLLTNLSPTDEPFLEKGLSDRGSRVRATIARLLVQIPESACGRRMRERAAGFLTFVKNNDESTPASLTIAPPEKFDKAWERDGLVEKPPQGIGNRAFWLEQIMNLAPPSYWERHLGLTATRLIELAAANEFGEDVLAGWARAAELFGCADWIPGLWDYWIDHRPRKTGTYPHERWEELCRNLFTSMPAHEADARILARLRQTDSEFMSIFVRTGTTRPVAWTRTVGEAYLELLRRLAGQAFGKEMAQRVVWLESLDMASVALPEACFEEAMKPWEVPPDTDTFANLWRSRTDRFVDTIAARKRFLDLVPLVNLEEAPRGKN